MPPLNCFSRICSAAAVLQSIVTPAHAARIVVDSVLDDNGVGCTLREAIVSFNSASIQTGCVNSGAVFGSSDTVDFDFTGIQTISLTNGQLSIARNLR